MISASGFDWPRGRTAAVLHWPILDEFVMLPSFSNDAAAGRKKTSVPTFAGSTPGPFQNDAVSLSNRLTVTIHSSVDSALRTFPALVPEQAGFWPQAKNPLYFPRDMLSKIISHDAFCPGSVLGSHSYPKSFSFVALAP